MNDLPSIKAVLEHYCASIRRDHGQANLKCHFHGDSHKSGADIIVEGLKHNRISCKSGIINYNKKLNIFLDLEISGCRTSSHKTINEKLIYIDNNHEDIIYSLS